MRFESDEARNRRKLLKHDVRFESAALVFDDPYALTQRDVSPSEEERWITLGSGSQDSVLFVIHIWRERDKRRSHPHYLGSRRDSA